MPKLKCVNQEGKYTDDDALETLIKYAIDPEKTPSGYVGFWGTNPEDPIRCMKMVSKESKKDSGVRLRHFILSVSNKETKKPKKLDKIARDIAILVSTEFQIVYGVHEDQQNHLHIHFIMNAVSYRDGHRYRGTHTEFKWLTKIMTDVLHHHRMKQPEYVSIKTDPEFEEYKKALAQTKKHIKPHKAIQNCDETIQDCAIIAPYVIKINI